MRSVGFCPGGILAPTPFIIHFLLWKKNKKAQETKKPKPKPIKQNPYFHVSNKWKTNLQQLYHSRSKQTASDSPLKSARKKKERGKGKENVFSVSHWRTSFFCFLVYFYFKKEYIVEILEQVARLLVGWFWDCGGVFFSLYAYLICRPKINRQNQICLL